MLFKPASNLSTAINNPAFSLDTLAADTLIVGLGTYLTATGAGSDAVFLDNTDAWTVTVSGSIFSRYAAGINLDAGNAGKSAITILEDGEIGGIWGIRLWSGATINNGGLIRAPLGSGIVIKNAGINTIVNTGTIIGGGSIIDENGLSTDRITNSGEILGAIVLAGGADVLVNTNKITGEVQLGNDNDSITNSGVINGGIDLGAGINTLVNSGTLFAFTVRNATTLTNSGIISGDVIDSATLTNSGTISGNVTNSATVKNSGTITGVVHLSPQNNTLSNAGSIASIVGANGADTVVNAQKVGKKTIVGTIINDVLLWHGVNKLTNPGTIGGTVIGGDGDDTIINSNTILGQVQLFNGTNKLTNSGFIGDTVYGGSGDDTITNSGIVGAGVAGSSGNDIVTDFIKVGKTTVHGKIVGTIDLADGADTFNGGNNAETVKDGNGLDTINLAGGNDIYFATGHTGSDGLDRIDGGLGRDTYDASGASTGNLINLDSIAHDLSPIDIVGHTSANTAVGSSLGTDTIFGFENAKGGSAYDAIYGNAAANEIDGGGSGDNLFGYGGNDVLHGGAGADGIAGGAGKDTLFGGSEDDYFQYFTIGDSGTTKATRDVIMDFEDNLDKIDLSFIDAIASSPGSAFTYINGDSSVTPATPFTGSAGQLRSYITANGIIVEGDVNGDAKADFSIEISDPLHLIALTSGDFIL